MEITVEEAARRLGIHPFEVVRHFTTHRQALPGFILQDEMIPTLMGWAGIENWWEEEDAVSSNGQENGETGRPEDKHLPRSDENPRRMVVRWIPFKLLHKGKIGASHTRIDNAWRGLSGDLKGFGKEVVDLMKRDGILLSKPTVNGEHIFLNPDRLENIQSLISWENPPKAYLDLVGE